MEGEKAHSIIAGCTAWICLTYHFNCFRAIDLIPFGVCDCDAKHQKNAEQLTTCGPFVDGESPEDDNIAHK